jgi:hypothetical protein
MPAGRPTKLTPEVIDALCSAALEGLPRAVMAMRAGVCKMTFHNWLSAAEADDPSDLHREFLYRLEKAEAEYAAARMERIHGGEPGWQGSAWGLERGPLRNYFAPPSAKLEHSGPDGGPIESRMLTADEIHKLTEAARKELLGDDD